MKNAEHFEADLVALVKKHEVEVFVFAFKCDDRLVLEAMAGYERYVQDATKLGYLFQQAINQAENQE
jgi:hypothetical protein